jgi:hypothetical protein
MVRTQITVSQEQMAGLRAEAQRRGISIAALLREAIDGVLQERDRRYARALDTVGSGRSDLGDLADEHDRYLTE